MVRAVSSTLWVEPECFGDRSVTGTHTHADERAPGGGDYGGQRKNACPCLLLGRHHHVPLDLRVERALLDPQSDAVQLRSEFVVSIWPARQQFRADKDRPIRLDLRNSNLDVVLLLPVRRNLPAIDD